MNTEDTPEVLTNPLFAGRPHDHGFDLIAGRDVTGRTVGRAYFERGHDGDGIVVSLDTRSPIEFYCPMQDGEIHSCYPDTSVEVEQWLHAHGWEIDSESLQRIMALGDENDREDDERVRGNAAGGVMSDQTTILTVELDVREIRALHNAGELMSVACGTAVLAGGVELPDGRLVAPLESALMKLAVVLMTAGEEA